MSGHSKWATIRRAKSANDAKRGKIFTKLGHEIALAAREGGPDPDANFRLRLVLDKARQANMPKDNVERAIRRGAGDGKGEGELEEVIYEGYGPSGIAILIEALTDNRNRAVSEIRHVFSRHGGNLGSEGCVAWMFSHKGYLAIDPQDTDPEEVALEVIDAGAEDFEISDGLVEVYTEMADFRAVRESLTGANLTVQNAQLSWVPQSTVTLEEREALRAMRLIDALEELDDVQQVYSNLDVPDELIARFEEEAA